MFKRVFDVGVSIFGLIILGLPLLLIALWVKIDSPGAVFFRQTRVGRFGREFRIFKFRSMHSDPQGSGPALTIGGNDPRITRAGRVLREYKLDELPQLLNVLSGDMSLVGPRPEVPRYVALYAPEVRKLVLSVRPGMTDPASVAFRNESDLLGGSSDPERLYVYEILPQKLRYYAQYVHCHGFISDVKIIFSTAIAVLSDKRRPR